MRCGPQHWSCALFFLVAIVGTSCSDKRPAAQDAEGALEVGRVSPKPVKASRTPKRTVAPSKDARRLCEALHQLPRQRRGACCNKRERFSLAPECARRVSEATGIRLASPAIDRCVEAMTRATTGCDWVGPVWRPVPEACLSTAQGQLQAAESCTSHLACAPGLHCAGLTIDAPGRCAAPRPVGERCDFGPDPLATILRDDVYEARHPPCDGGYCRLGRCVAFAAVGQPCGAKNGCGPKARCADGLCVAGALGAQGEPCVKGGCQAGLRCMSGNCDKPAKPGTKCESDEQCFGTCREGRCAMTCDVSPVVRPLSRP